MTTREILEQAVTAKIAINSADTGTKNKALANMADELLAHTDAILEANKQDVEAAKGKISDVMIDRLMLDAGRIEGMAKGIRELICLEDPAGKVIRTVERPNGIIIEKTAAPMGVIAIIYESRPNVTSDAAALCIKSGNVCVLRSGKEAWKSADAVVKAILGETPVSSYISGKEIDSCKEEEVPLRSHMMTDYDLIVEQAQKQGFEFFILQGKAYFRKKQKVTSTILTLSPGQGILRARLSLSGQQLVKKIEIRSIDETNGKQIKGEAALSGTFGKGSGYKKLLGDSRQVFYEPGVQDAAEAKARAQARMDQISQQFGELECECVGIPELSPGRFVEVDELSSQADRKYYITYVRHVLDEDGYRTYIRAGVNSL